MNLTDLPSTRTGQNLLNSINIDISLLLDGSGDGHELTLSFDMLLANFIIFQV